MQDVRAFLLQFVLALTLHFFSTGVKLLRSPMDSSTSNLQRHVARCITDPKAGSIEMYAHGSTYTPGRLRFYMVEEVTVHHRPFALFEDAAMIKIITMFNPMARLVSANTISTDAKEVHSISKVNVVATLDVRVLSLIWPQTNCKQSVRNRVHLVFDAWASGNKRSCQGLALVYWLKEELHIIYLDMVAYVLLYI